MKRIILAVVMCCMASLGLRAQQCDTIRSFPWEANFSGGLGCWQQSGNGYWTAANSQAIYGQLNSGVTSTGYITITTPVLQFGNSTTGLRLWWKDQRNYMYPNLRVMVLKENGTRDTLYNADMGNSGQGYVQHSVSLAAYANQTVRIAFEVRLSAGGYSYRGTLSQIGIYTQYGPLGTLSLPKVAAVGDSLQAVFNLIRGQAPINYSWHSTMLGDLAGGDTVHLVYPMSGWDTLTVTAANSYDTLVRTAVVRVHDCQTVSTFPWYEDFDGFDTAAYNACWTISGWQHQSNGSSMSIVDEEGVYTRYAQLMNCSSNGKYMLSPAISIPSVDYEHLRLWVQCRKRPAIRISPTASRDTSDYIDTLCTGANTTVMGWHLFDLSAYAGQTIRVGLFRDGYTVNLNSVRVDYDLFPVLEQMDAPDRSRTDSTVTCSIGLRRGALGGLTFYWHSSLTGTTLIDTGYNGTSAFHVTYTVGGLDTITVIAANSYGADTAVRVVEVADCNPALVLPWREDFSYGIGCWYLTQNVTYVQWMSNYSGSGNNINWIASSQCGYYNTTADAWLVSKAVTIPSDTTLAVRLFWRVGLSAGAGQPSVYRVMVSTDSDRTDTSTYVELYCDTNALTGWNNMALRSVSLAAYAGQTVYIAFRNQPTVIRSASLLIDDVEVRATVAPRVTVAADGNTYYYGDTATFVATIEEGIRTGLTYTWHSTLLDSTFVAGDTLRLCYGMLDGWDTVTVVATNAYGSGTATVSVRSQIITQPSATITHNAAMVGDTTLFESHLGFFIYDGLNLRWHSTMMDTTVIGSTMSLVYDASGIDTVTLIVSTLYGIDTVIISVSVSSYPLPQLAFVAPTSVLVSDTNYFVASLNGCSRNDLYGTVHSSLLDSTWAIGLQPDSVFEWSMVYGFSGTDTVTVIVYNRYGADTAVMVVDVIDCRGVAVLPFTPGSVSVTSSSTNNGASMANTDPL